MRAYSLFGSLVQQLTFQKLLNIVYASNVHVLLSKHKCMKKRCIAKMGSHFAPYSPSELSFG